MIHANENNLLDFLAEGFLQQGASVTYDELAGIPVLKVTAEDALPRLYTPAEEGVSKMTFLEQINFGEIIIPVLKSEEKLRLKDALAKMEISGINVFRLSLQQHYLWYSREFLNKRMKASASAEAFPVCRGTDAKVGADLSCQKSLLREFATVKNSYLA